MYTNDFLTDLSVRDLRAVATYGGAATALPPVVQMLHEKEPISMEVSARAFKILQSGAYKVKQERHLTALEEEKKQNNVNAPISTADVLRADPTQVQVSVIEVLPVHPPPVIVRKIEPMEIIDVDSDTFSCGLIPTIPPPTAFRQAVASRLGMNVQSQEIPKKDPLRTWNRSLPRTALDDVTFRLYPTFSAEMRRIIVEATHYHPMVHSIFRILFDERIIANCLYMTYTEQVRKNCSHVGEGCTCHVIFTLPASKITILMNESFESTMAHAAVCIQTYRFDRNYGLVLMSTPGPLPPATTPLRSLEPFPGLEPGRPVIRLISVWGRQTAKPPEHPITYEDAPCVISERIWSAFRIDLPIALAPSLSVQVQWCFPGVNCPPCPSNCQSQLTLVSWNGNPNDGFSYRIRDWIQTDQSYLIAYGQTDVFSCRGTFCGFGNESGRRANLRPRCFVTVIDRSLTSPRVIASLEIFIINGAGVMKKEAAKRNFNPINLDCNRWRHLTEGEAAPWRAYASTAFHLTNIQPSFTYLQCPQISLQTQQSFSLTVEEHLAFVTPMFVFLFAGPYSSWDQQVKEEYLSGVTNFLLSLKRRCYAEIQALAAIMYTLLNPAFGIPCVSVKGSLGTMSIKVCPCSLAPFLYYHAFGIFRFVGSCIDIEKGVSLPTTAFVREGIYIS
jgi:hypothetical protein